jgi:hypothetical protein
MFQKDGTQHASQASNGTKGNNMKHILCISLMAFCVLPAFAKEEKEEPKSMAKHYGIKEIHKVIAVHYETMDQKKEPKEIVLLDKKEATKKIAEILQGLSSKGSIYKSWPLNIPTIQVVILHDEQKYSILRIDNSRLQRPGGGGYGLEDIKEVQKLVEILKKKTHNKPDAPDKK